MNVVLWDPALVVRLGSCSRGWAVDFRASRLINRLPFLSAARTAFHAVAALPRRLLLEECSDPRRIEKVA